MMKNFQFLYSVEILFKTLCNFVSTEFTSSSGQASNERAASCNWSDEFCLPDDVDTLSQALSPVIYTVIGRNRYARSPFVDLRMLQVPQPKLTCAARPLPDYFTFTAPVPYWSSSHLQRWSQGDFGEWKLNRVWSSNLQKGPEKF